MLMIVLVVLGDRPMKQYHNHMVVINPFAHYPEHETTKNTQQEVSYTPQTTNIMVQDMFEDITALDALSLF